MANRIIKWFLFTVLFAFIPMGIGCLILFMTDMRLDTYNFNGEILFFIIMLCATSLCDMIELNKTISNVALTSFIALFVLLVIFSAGIYTVLLYCQLTENIIFFTQDKTFLVSAIMAILSFVAGTIIQILCGIHAVVKSEVKK